MVTFILVMMVLGAIVCLIAGFAVGNEARGNNWAFPVIGVAAALILLLGAYVIYDDFWWDREWIECQYVEEFVKDQTACDSAYQGPDFDTTKAGGYFFVRVPKSRSSEQKWYRIQVEAKIVETIEISPQEWLKNNVIPTPTSQDPNK